MASNVHGDGYLGGAHGQRPFGNVPLAGDELRGGYARPPPGAVFPPQHHAPLAPAPPLYGAVSAYGAGLITLPGQNSATLDLSFGSI